jgi:hypothetical protein
MKYFYLILTSLLIPFSVTYASFEDLEPHKREGHSTPPPKKNSEIESCIEREKETPSRESILEEEHTENRSLEMKGNSSLGPKKSTFEDFIVSLMDPEELDQIKQNTESNCFKIDLPEIFQSLEGPQEKRDFFDSYEILNAEKHSNFQIAYILLKFHQKTIKNLNS